jgi:tRNA-splicing ligase RtcB
MRCSAPPSVTLVQELTVSHSNRFLSSLHRLDATRLAIDNPYGVPVTLVAGQDVSIEADAIEQLLDVIGVAGTLAEIAEAQRAGRVAPFWGEVPGTLERVALTPDFHRGSGIPVGTVLDARGFVIPQAIGNDVCCGMRLLVTDLGPDELRPHLDAIEDRLRGIFFRGQRDLPLSPRQREALLREGLWGLLETHADNAGQGLWRQYDARVQEDDLVRVHFQGVLPAAGVFAFADYIRGSGASDGRDAQLGSVGGGNHFVELQRIEELLDGSVAHAWGVASDRVAIMVHSGSVGLGHAVGGFFKERARELFPAELRHPAHGFYVLPTAGPHAALAARYLDALRNAANFAFGNRLFLGLMATRAIEEVVGREIGARLVHDAPHNLVWEERDRYLHRKGACPALGIDPTGPAAFRYTGQPVIVPGSMGSSSFLLAGEGAEVTLSSACHGAGRALSRGRSRAVSEATYAETMQPLRVICPIDPRSPEVRLRSDVLVAYHDRLREEAPYAYKEITPVIETLSAAGVARPVARLTPIATVKG